MRFQPDGQELYYLITVCPKKTTEKSDKSLLFNYKKLLKSLPFGMIIVDSNDRILDFNNTFVQMFGYHARQLSGSYVNDSIVPAELLDEARALSEDVIGGSSRIYETIRMDAAKRKFDVAITAIPFELQDGEKLILGLYQDISDRKAIEAKLLEHERELQRIVNWLPGMVYRCHFDENYTMIFVSEGAIRVTGYEAESFLQHKVIYNNIVHPEDRARLWKKWQESVAKNELFDMQYRIIAANASIRWIWERGRGVCNEQGELIYLEGYLEDVTLLKQAQEKVQTERDLLQALLDNIPDTIYFKDKQCRFTRVNKAQANVLGINDPAEAIGRTDHDFFDEAHANNSFADEQKLMLTGVPVVSKQEHIQTVNGWKWFSASKVPLKDENDEISGMVGISRDITVYKQMETNLREKEAELLKSNQGKDKLFSVIAHDLRSPFNSFLLLTEILVGEGYDYQPNELADLANLLHRSAKGVSELLENLLSWAAIQRHTLIQNPEFFLLDETIKNTIEQYKNQFTSKKIELNLQLKEKQMIQSDLSMLNVILRNLISNALKFTPEGGQIKVATQIVDGEAVIEVSDSGIGIPAEMLDKLFDVQLKGRKGTNGEPSSGLGMILVKEFSNELEGKIQVTSEVGKGTQVSLRIPLFQKEAL